MYRKLKAADGVLVLGPVPPPAHLRKCLQNDELVEYAFTRSNEFHFATASIFSKTGMKPPPFWKSKWFAAYCPASPFSFFSGDR